MKKIIIVLGLFLCAGVMAQAETTENAEGTAKAKIVKVASISHTANAALDFGTLIRGAGTVTLQAAATPSPQYAGPVAAAGTAAPTADHFDLADLENGVTYTVHIPTSVQITGPAGSDPMVVELTPSATTITDARNELYVGGVLHVAADQEPGEYSAHYNVNLTY